MFDGSQTPLRGLRAASSKVPDEPFITIGGSTVTYGSADRIVRDAGSGLASLGVNPGDRVIVLLPNRLEAVWAWFAVQYIGAIDAPVSVEAPGPFLTYLVEDVSPAAVITTPELLERLIGASSRPPALAIVVGADDQYVHPEGIPRCVLWEDVVGAEGSVERELPSAYLPGTIMYSSGTTGPSKGVVLSQGYYSTLAVCHTTVAGWQPGYRVYCAQPLCHVDARSAVIDTLHVLGHVRLGTRFSASRFWDDVEEHDSDLFFYVGTMIHLLHKQPERLLTASSKRRTGMGSATPPAIHRDFEKRFNVELVEGYGMTELGIMTGQWKGATEPGHIGRALPWVDLEVVDDLDQPLPDDAVGELVARPKGPHVHMMGYWNRPEATVDAWRGLWFHTGDLVRRRADGNFVYVGRNKDSIRRRGENVSAWEVEQAATEHPLVLEAAAIGVASDLGEEDVALLVVPHARGVPDPVDLRAHIAGLVPRFAVPRYIEIVPSLPKTPSERIAKGVLRTRGLSGAAYDAEAG